MIPKNLDPDTWIYVIVGHDNFDHDNYIKDVSLSQEEADNLIQRIKPNGTMPDIYWVQPTPLSWLQDKKKHGELDKRISDPVSISSILDKIEGLFKEEKKVDRMLSLMPGKGLLDMYDKIGSKTSLNGLRVTRELIKQKILDRIL